MNRFSSTKSCYVFSPRNKLRKFTCFIITHQYPFHTQVTPEKTEILLFSSLRSLNKPGNMGGKEKLGVHGVLSKNVFQLMKLL